MEKLQYNFPKIRGARSKAVCNFSENSSDLVARPFPKEGDVAKAKELLKKETKETIDQVLMIIYR